MLQVTIDLDLAFVRPIGIIWRITTLSLSKGVIVTVMYSGLVRLEYLYSNLVLTWQGWSQIHALN